MRAFWELSTERQFGQDFMGPIPWSKIVDYGTSKMLSDRMIEVFVQVMRSLDEAFLKWQREDKAAAT